MQQIDPVFLLQPLLSIAMVVGAMAYWWLKRPFRGLVLALSSGAYLGAVAAKQGLDYALLPWLTSGVGNVTLGAFYGAQTVFLEVGLAYVFAVYGVRRRRVGTAEAVPYGLSLAFWENGVLLGVLSLFNLGVVYLMLASNSTAASALYSQLQAAQPLLFQGLAQALPTVALGTLERLSSMLAHLAWGVLVILSASTRKRVYLVVALPMGLLDALVPFASGRLALFEGTLFALSLLFIAVAWLAISRESRSAPAPQAVSTASHGED